MSVETKEKMINRNMRCIEIACEPDKNQTRTVINRNMRCIEINQFMRNEIEKRTINRNMRCIEMTAYQPCTGTSKRD